MNWWEEKEKELEAKLKYEKERNEVHFGINWYSWIEEIKLQMFRECREHRGEK